MFNAVVSCRRASSRFSPGARALTRVVALVLLILPTVPQVSAAQRGALANAPKGIQIVLLGTNDGPPINVNRSEPSTVLIVDGRRYLIDCGIGTIRRLARARISSASIRTIFFTHLHVDHAMGLADLISNDYWVLSHASTAPTIDIYGPPETAALLDAALKYVAIPYGIFQAEGLPWTADAAHFTAHEFSHDGVVFQDDKIRVVAAENTHYALMPEQYRARMKSFALRFETPYGVIVFTGDTGPSDAVTTLARGADVLITEATVADSTRTAKGIAAAGARNHWSADRTRILAGHFTREHLDEQEIGQMATRAGVKAVILHHYSPRDTAAYAAGVKKYYSGPVFAGADLQRYCLGGKGSGAAALHPCQ